MLNDTEMINMIGGVVPYPMLSDETGSIGKAYGVFDEKLGTTLRGTFIIDNDGNVCSMEVLNTPVGRSSSEILRRLQAFQAYSTTKELIPADWKPGDKTLAEKIESVGSIWKVWKPDMASK